MPAALERCERTRYRITSSIVVVALLLSVLSTLVHIESPAPPATTNGDLAPWDPCQMRVNYGPMHNLMVFIAFAAFVVCLVQGLLDHSGPRWLAIAALPAMILTFQDELREMSNCYRGTHLALSLIVLGSDALMFLHHAFQPSHQIQARPSRHRIRRWMLNGILMSLFSLVLVWFVFDELAYLSGPRDWEYWATLISNVQRYIALPAFVLFMAALILTATCRGKTPRDARQA